MHEHFKCFLMKFWPKKSASSTHAMANKQINFNLRMSCIQLTDVYLFIEWDLHQFTLRLRKNGWYSTNHRQIWCNCSDDNLETPCLVKCKRDQNSDRRAAIFDFEKWLPFLKKFDQSSPTSMEMLHSWRIYYWANYAMKILKIYLSFFATVRSHGLYIFGLFDFLNWSRESGRNHKL